MLTPIEDFENQLLLSTFSLASHALRILEKNALLDDHARQIIRGHLELLNEKVLAVPGLEGQAMLMHLDTLTQILPPTSRDGSHGGKGPGS